jgi:hypothetical protein
MLLLDRPEDALALHRRGLRQAWTRGQPREVAYGLEGVAASLASTGRGLPLAARLIGTARALREGIGAPLTAELETRVQEHSLETLRSELGSDGLDSALEHGAGIRVDAAVALALADVD